MSDTNPATAADFDPFATEQRDWENPGLLARNRLPDRGWFFRYPNADAAKAHDFLGQPSTPWAVSLNGDWKFHWAPHPYALPADCWAADFDDDAFDTLAVPSHWQMQLDRPYDKPHYTNVR
ncbi:MAG: sugar-binding domain-containing protein, partial [Planctomycetota bacterium]